MPIIKPKSSTTTSGGTGTGTTGTTGGSTTGTITAHTHQQTDIVGLSTTLASKASVAHTHIVSDIPGLNTTLAAKADVSSLLTKANLVHTHVSSDVTGLADLLSVKSDKVHTHAVDDVVGLATLMNTKADISALNTKASMTHTHSISDVSDLSTMLAAKANTVHNHDISNVTGLRTELDGLNVKISQLQTAGSTVVPNHTHVIDNVTGLTTKLDSIDSEIATLKSAGNNGIVAAHTHEISNVTSLTSQLLTITTDISSTKTAVTANSNQITGLVSSVSTLSDKVGYSNSTNTVKQDVDVLKTSSTDNTNKISALTTRVAALEVTANNPLVQLPVNTDKPIVTGLTSVGSILTTTNGSWNNSPTSYTYQWYRRIAGSTTAIPTAIAKTYTIQLADIGATIYCSVNAINSVGSSSAVSIDTAVVTTIPTVTTNPFITGSNVLGSTLTVNDGMWTSSPTLTYQWTRGGLDIPNATTKTYVSTTTDINQSIACKVIGTNQAGSITANTASVTIIASPSSLTSPVISGSNIVGGALTVTNGSWSNSPASYAYQWKRNGATIVGSTSSVYSSLAGDVGLNITCDVSATNVAGTTTVTSSNSITILAAVSATPVNTTAPVITGSLIVGSQLSVSTGVWTNSPSSYAYQWNRNGIAINSATSSTYTTVSADIGATISCIVTATNSQGSVACNSANTAVIGNVMTPTTPTTQSPVTYPGTGTRTFNVGPNQQYPDLDTVPWGTLTAGDIVNIYYRDVPYNHNIMVFGVGTETNKIIINGVTDANGNRPKINLANSKTATGSSTVSSTAYPEYGEILGGIVLKRCKGAKTGAKPEHIIIRNLEIFGGSNGSKFTALNGSTVTRSGSAGVWLHDTRNCTVENCIITDNAFGIFVQAKNGTLEEANENVIIKNNKIFGNGVVGSYLEHNIYMQSTSPIIEGNYLGSLRSGALGSTYKSRSSGEIFRFNYVESHARSLDFVHSEEQDLGIRARPDYMFIHCYGNIIVNSSSQNAIHVGGDNGGEDDATNPLVRPGSDFYTPTSLWYRNQLFFYNNTYITKTNYASLFDLSLAGGQQTLDGVVHQRTRVDAWNNIFYITGSNCAWVESVGALYFRGKNFVYAPNGIGNSRYTSTRFNVEILGTNMTAGSVNFVDESTGNYAIQNSSICSNAGDDTAPIDLPTSFKNYPVSFQPIGTPTNGMIPRYVVNGGADIGAFEYGVTGSTAPTPTTAPTNSTLPIVSGNSALGSVLTVNDGIWSGSPSSFTYQWKRGANTIGMATSKSYTTTAGDIGMVITCEVTAINNIGSSKVSSSNGITITNVNALPIPANTIAPAITGSNIVGGILTVTNGTWNNSPTIYTYQWKVNGTNISGATNSTYLTQAGDVGNTVSCVVTANNTTGSATAASANSMLIISSSNSVVTPPTSAPTIGDVVGANPVTTALQGIRTFEVGTGKQYADPDTVPWGTLTAGDVVNIYYRDTPYNSLIAISGKGTSTNQIIINGVTDANGRRPIFDYSNGGVVASGTQSIWGTQNTTYGYQRLGGITIINGQSAQYLVDTPKFITIKNIEIKGAYTGNVSGTSVGPTIKLLNGATASWFTGAGIHLQSSEDVTIENCVITDCSFGIFTMAKGDMLWYTNQRVNLRNNRIYRNGVVGEYYQHNVYMQATNPVIEGNYIGSLRAGANGSAYKSRSSGEIFRYNWVESHARAIDFVHSEEQTQGIQAQPDYKYVHCYGNVIVNDSNVGQFATNPIHFGGDNGGEDGIDGNGAHWNSLVSPGSLNSTPIQLLYREQLYFYNNTVIMNGPGTAYSSTHFFDLSLAGGNQGVAGYVHPRTRVDAWNNVFYAANVDISTWVEYAGALNLRGTNFVYGNIGDHESQRPDWVSISKDTVISGAANFQNIAGCNYSPTATSPFVDKGSTPVGLPATFQNYPVQYQPRIRSNGMIQRNNTGSIDCGAFESDVVAANVPALTTLPAISGLQTIGSTLTANQGVWTNSPTFAYQWLRNNVVIAGATSNIYTTTADDNGYNISVRITATANSVSVTAVSNPLFVGTTPVPTQTAPAPTNTIDNTLPYLIGAPLAGQRLYVYAGSSDSNISNITYTWKIDGVVISNTNSWYDIKTTDVGKSITVAVTVGTKTVNASNVVTILSGNSFTDSTPGLYNFAQPINAQLSAIDSKWVGSNVNYTIKDGYAVISDIAKTYGVQALYTHGSAIKFAELCIVDGITTEVALILRSGSNSVYEMRVSPTSVQVRKNGTWLTDVQHNIDTLNSPVVARIGAENNKFYVDINNIRLYSAVDTNISVSDVVWSITTNNVSRSRIDYFRVGV